ncbi:cupin domain-containing protein [Paracoccus sp. YLB-12]|uniref:Cupin domain-containing protein n=1 Tax=Paracoccus maritimus TaxID=2933292 RepID=A0ABT2KDX1_9RHOB|nr:cupin domain-containing protein [Paracoccus sp. YLB-12]MCT4334740.1 cupin domain-containing protein [Paracoccus sp. YLB-12]
MAGDKAEVPPKVDYWNLYVGDDGISRHRRCTLTEFERKSISGAAAPQWIGREVAAHITVLFTVLPPGWVGEWHENPAPQWIIPLSGRWFVEAMDGSRVEMGPGEISFGADQGCREVDGHKGHLSGTVGEAPCHMMLVQIETAPKGAGCPFN